MLATPIGVKTHRFKNHSSRLRLFGSCGCVDRMQEITPLWQCAWNSKVLLAVKRKLSYIQKLKLYTPGHLAWYTLKVKETIISGGQLPSVYTVVTTHEC